MTDYDTGVIATSPQVYLACDDASGTLQDGTTNNRDATATGGTATYQATGPTINGVAQSAVQFPGNGGFTISSFPANSGGARSVSAWIYLPDSSVRAEFISRQQTNEHEWAFYHGGGGSGWFEYFDNTNVLEGTALWDPALDNATWFNLIATYSNTDHLCKIYKNGTLSTDAKTDGTEDICSNSTAPVGIGHTGQGANFLISGARLAKVAIWDRRITDAEIASLATGVFSTPQTARPDADVSTTGWSTAPLFSKINESSADGTVITATAS